jgi:hypothetical protein
LLPQHFTPPALVTTHEWKLPVEMATTPLVRPITSRGTLREAVVPSPSCPEELPPQHRTPPALVSAHV